MGKTALSTASFCLWPITAERKVEICRDFKFSRIEIAIPHIKMLKSFNLSEPFCEHIKSFREITVHAPWCDINYGDNARTRVILDHLRNLHDKLKVEAFIFHFDRVKNLKVLLDSGLPVYLENSDKPGSWPEFRSVLRRTGIKCVLNVNRAIRTDNYLNDLVTEFGDKVAQVQVSGFVNEARRMPILAAGQQHLLDSVKFIKAPFVIEGLFSPEDYVSIAREKNAISEKITGGNIDDSGVA